jgi:hypothetical protein
MLLIPIQIKAMGEEEEEEEKKQMKKIYQDILFSTDPIDKKKGVKALWTRSSRLSITISEHPSIKYGGWTSYL